MSAFFRTDMLSSQHREGVEGARPHTHSKSAEFFYVLDGELQLLAGSQVITAGKGDLVVVPPDMAHAFATTPGHSADFLIILAPGLERALGTFVSLSA